MLFCQGHYELRCLGGKGATTLRLGRKIVRFRFQVLTVSVCLTLQKVWGH